MRIRPVLLIGLVVVTAGGAAGSAGNTSGQPVGQIVFTRSLSKNGTPSLYVMATDGSSVRLQAHNASEAAVAPDGQRIAFVRDSAIWVIGRDGSDPHQLTRMDTQPPKKRPTPRFDSGPAWSPDGQTIYFSRWVTAYSESLFSLHQDGTTLRRLTQQSFGWDESPAPSPDGRLIVYATTDEGSGVHDLANDLSAVTPLGRPARLPFRLPAIRESREGHPAAPKLRNPAWSPNGRALAYEASDTSWGTGFASGLYVSSTSGSSVRRLTADAGAPAWSPDGKWIAFTDGRHIWLVRADGTGRRQLTRTAAYDRDPAWLPPTR